MLEQLVKWVITYQEVLKHVEMENGIQLQLLIVQVSIQGSDYVLKQMFDQLAQTGEGVVKSGIYQKVVLNYPGFEGRTYIFH